MVSQDHSCDKAVPRAGMLPKVIPNPSRVGPTLLPQCVCQALWGEISIHSLSKYLLRASRGQVSTRLPAGDCADRHGPGLHGVHNIVKVDAEKNHGKCG